MTVIPMTVILMTVILMTVLGGLLPAQAAVLGVCHRLPTKALPSARPLSTAQAQARVIPMTVLGGVLGVATTAPERHA